MRRPHPISLLCFIGGALAMINVPRAAEAAPFKSSCASMQAYFQQRFPITRAGEKVGYSNFENISYRTSENDNALGALGTILSMDQSNVPTIDNLNPRITPTFISSCDGGYITVSSPQGTKVCQGTLSYSAKTGISYSTRNCRWRN